ncbi:MAG: hypothetical protein KC729_13120, partial [Candidatus Eisenbacteria bacterium]|nr:hypothetical protein [Candidatus Eisenbacteria bacterium]
MRPCTLAVTAALVLVTCCAVHAETDCIDYESYLHLAGRTDLSLGYFALDIQGDHAYLTTEPVGGGGSWLQIVDYADPTAPYLVGSLALPSLGYDVTVAGSYAYVADYDYGLAIVDVTNPGAPQLVGHVDTPPGAYGVAVEGHYASVAAATAFYVIDVGVPTNPVVLGSIPIGGWCNRVVVTGAIAYVGDAQNGLLIINVFNPAAPRVVGTLEIYSYVWCSVAAAGPLVYLTDGQYLHVIDPYDFEHPREVGALSLPGWSTDVAVQGGRAYVAMEIGGLQVVDVSLPTAPRLLGTAVTGGNYGVEVSGDYAYLSNSSSGLAIVDVSNPESPAILGSVDTPGYAHALAVEGAYAYVADGAGGLVVVDRADPTDPHMVDQLGLPNAQGVWVAGEHAYVAERDRGMAVLDITIPDDPQLVGKVAVPLCRDVVTSDSYAYVAREDGLDVV